MARTAVTYQEVFGAPLGSEIRNKPIVPYFGSPAAESLRDLLRPTSFFKSRQYKLAGGGPVVRPGFVHEFNRHHAGLAVDIMLEPKTDEVTLGQNLVVLFNHFASVIRFRGMIYQDVTVDIIGTTWVAKRWAGGNHDNHIHIDWHTDPNTHYPVPPVLQVPLRQADGSVVPIPAANKQTGIADQIAWTTESQQTITDLAFKNALNILVDQFTRGQLLPMDLDRSLAVQNSPYAQNVASQLAGRWSASVGGWQGLFVFNGDHTLYWADNASATRHTGRWVLTADDIHWRFDDQGDFRTFVLPLSEVGQTRSGTVLPAGQGTFRMSKTP